MIPAKHTSLPPPREFSRCIFCGTRLWAVEHLFCKRHWDWLPVKIRRRIWTRGWSSIPGVPGWRKWIHDALGIIAARQIGIDQERVMQKRKQGIREFPMEAEAGALVYPSSWEEKEEEIIHIRVVRCTLPSGMVIRGVARILEPIQYREVPDRPVGLFGVEMGLHLPTMDDLARWTVVKDHAVVIEPTHTPTPETGQ